MSKWPVIYLDFKSISFSTKPRDVKFEDVKPKFIEEIIKPAFKEYDYLLFLNIAENACLNEYGSYSDETYKRLLSDFKLSKITNMETKIKWLLKIFGKDMPFFINTFYKYYTGQIDKHEELIDALKFLMEMLYSFYKRKVIVLVDEHDTPVTSIHSAMSLTNYDENEELMESIKQYSGVVCDVFKKIAKDNPHLKKFLMFGISTGILNLDNSGFNNLRTYDVLNNDYPEYFGFDEGEISSIVDSAFEKRSEEQKSIIKANAKEWYNGYHFGKKESLHSTYSTA
jgi:hypothetical protein